ncbi:MAG: FAD:protein FMN transferase [Lachnospiraceae bacterium]|nr:FAD:protein FMN transferase [Lachnospiraceae bacterium]
MTKASLSHFIRNLSLTILCLAASATVSGCGSQPAQPVSKSGYLLNTLVTVSIYETDHAISKSSETILDDCLIKCKEYEGLFSRTIEGSDISRINHAAPAFVTVSEDTATLLQSALDYCEWSDGLIDITIAPVKDLWGFSDLDTAKIPDETALQSALDHVDYHCVEIDGRKVRLTDPDAAIDLGFIAKGYIADRLKEYLMSEGVTSGIINLGGNVLTIGTKQGNAFRVGIQRPFADTGVPITSVACRDASVVTSGVYERYFTQGGTDYHHILNPSTGYPASSDLLSATILSQDSTTGDALSTTCLLLGLDKAVSLIDSLEGVDAVFITTDYEIIYSSDFKNA